MDESEIKELYADIQGHVGIKKEKVLDLLKNIEVDKSSTWCDLSQISEIDKRGNAGALILMFVSSVAIGDMGKIGEEPKLFNFLFKKGTGYTQANGGEGS